MDSLKEQDNTGEYYLRQCHLLRYISYELIAVSILAGTGYAVKGLWYLLAIIGGGGLLVFLNLVFFHYKKNINLSSNLLIFIVFLTITMANYFVWGISSEYSYWFYIIPLLAAASLAGWGSLIVYSTLALFMILASGIVNLPPFYHLPPQLMHVIEWANHLFAYLITVTIVVHLIMENKLYEKILFDKTRLLADEKQKLKNLAYFDQLTELPNRQLFKNHLQDMLHLKPAGKCVTVFFMDLDNLKSINDSYGHDAGDSLLMEAAKRLKNGVRGRDFVARLGGDEFTAVILHHPEDDVPRLIEKRIIQEFEKLFSINGVECYCSISIGYSNYPKDSQSVRELMVNADRAMYAAKNQKRYKLKS